MAHNKANNLSMKKEDYKFKFSGVSYLNLKQNKSFKEQIDKCLYQQFDVRTPKLTRKNYTRQYPCHLSYHVLLKNEVTHFQGVGCCCLSIH